mmetsp:Transcript_76500/g.185151  ORF Transcript_76500/g.185151 Transcript_76500/m.185151 type:complete len:412 (-) Transcript_76500:86-1321(-)
MGTSCSCLCLQVSAKDEDPNHREFAGYQDLFFRDPAAEPAGRRPEPCSEPSFLSAEKAAESFNCFPKPASLQPEIAEETTGVDELSKRHAAYLQRQNSKKERRSKSDKQKFLSGLPEVEADIAYRFTFVVVGDAAESVVEAACGSISARSLPGGEALYRGVQRSPPQSGFEAKVHRCLCRVGTLPPEAVTAPDAAGAVVGRRAGLEGLNVGQDAALAKLAFHLVAPHEDVPACGSRLEAQSTVLVVVLTLDIRGDVDYLEMQLWDAVGRVERSQSEVSTVHQPRWAVVLCLEEGADSDWADGRWAPTLDVLEQQLGRLWRFGPVLLADADALHRAFAEMACKRIIRNRAKSVRGPAGEGEQDDETGSAGSLGSSRPPVFEAECDGADCAPEALEGRGCVTIPGPTSVEARI